METSNLKQRLAVSAIGMLVLFLVVMGSYHSFFQYIFVLFIASSISCALWEYYQIAKAKGTNPLVQTSIVFSFIYAFAVFLSTTSSCSVLPLVVLFLGMMGFFGYYLFTDANPLINLSTTFFGIIYVTIPLTASISINYNFFPNQEQDGRWWLFYLFTVTKMTDVGAYFIGKSFGKKKLALRISPKKTIEGAVSGLLFAILTSFIFYFSAHVFFTKPIIQMTFWQSLWLGALFGLLAQIGDLAESLLKRDAGIKDSNHLPGLGGLLDIVDSLIFTTPVLYLFLKAC